MNTQPAPNDAQSENRFVADKLDEVAQLLDQQNASLFRVRAYRDAASYLRGLPHPVRLDYQRGGKQGLDDLPTIGQSIAATIAEILDTGASSLLDRLRGAADPEQVLQAVPMIGPALARQIHDGLGIETLEALEAAAYDGRLETLKGIGPRRVESLRHSLSDMLARRRPRQVPRDRQQPSVADILAVDQAYRGNVEKLPMIKPRQSCIPNGKDGSSPRSFPTARQRIVLAKPATGSSSISNAPTSLKGKSPLSQNTAVVLPVNASFAGRKELAKPIMKRRKTASETAMKRAEHAHQEWEMDLDDTSKMDIRRLGSCRSIGILRST
jgi:hypothetical protein